MAFLVAGGSGGISGHTSQSAAIETGDFGGGTRDFGTVNLGSGSAAGASDNTLSYIVGGIVVIALLTFFLKK